MRFFILSILFSFFLLNFCDGEVESPDLPLNPFTSKFNQFFDELEEELSKDRWKFASQFDYPINEVILKELREASPRYIVPLILKRTSPVQVGKPRWISFVLASISNSVCKLDGWPHFDPWCGEALWIQWYGGYEFSKERFDFLYNLLLQKRKENDESKIMMINEALRSRGIFMLPFLMEKIIEEDHELLPIVQKMFDKYGDEIKGKTEKEIIEWWKNNKEKYQLPSKNLEKYCYLPPFMINAQKEYTIEEKIYLLYDDILGWRGRHIIQGTAPSQRETSRKSIELAKLIGYENTPQFRFLVDLGEEALPYLFLKLKEEKERFTLPVIEKIMNKKLSPEEVEKHIKDAEQLLNKPEPVTMRTWTSRNGNFSIQAKYLSAEETKVTIEKENGTIITVDLSKLSQEDRDYVKRQLESETQKQKNKQDNL